MREPMKNNLVNRIKKPKKTRCGTDKVAGKPVTQEDLSRKPNNKPKKIKTNQTNMCVPLI